MKKAAADLNFEAAAELRDKLLELKKTLQEMEEIRIKNGYKDGCQDSIFESVARMKII